MPYTVSHTVQAGIERVVYTPERRRFCDTDRAAARDVARRLVLAALAGAAGGVGLGKLRPLPAGARPLAGERLGGVPPARWVRARVRGRWGAPPSLHDTHLFLKCRFWLSNALRQHFVHSANSLLSV